MKVHPGLKTILKRKAHKSDCTYKISGIAFDKKGDILGSAVNKHSEWNVLEKENGEGRAGTAKHVERELIKRYGQNIKTILICRVGHSGIIRKIDPCLACKKVADKLGIKIISVNES
mgnify:CR=1 FL=1